MTLDRDTVDKSKEFIENKKQAINLQAAVADAYYAHSSQPRLGNMVPDEDEMLLKDADAKDYAEAKFNLNKHCAETLIDGNPMEYSLRCTELAKTALLALPERTEEAINIIKNAAINCIMQKDADFAARGMLGVATSLCDIAEKRPDLQVAVRSGLQDIIAADKKAQEFGPADNLRYAIKRRRMQDVLLPQKSASVEKAIADRMLANVNE